MTRAQLEHIIRAAATIADDDEIVALGSQAVLGLERDRTAVVVGQNVSSFGGAFELADAALMLVELRLDRP
jgi:hypothetical protein